MIADPEQLKILAASMAKPRRCGGLDYIDGKPFYRVGSRHVPAEIYRQGEEATAAYLKDLK
jgi:hypothetical protein